MVERNSMELYAWRVARDAAAARRRSLSRRAGGPLIRKYVDIVPSVFSARGECTTFRLLLPAASALERLKERAVLTLDSATEILGDFRFGRGNHLYAYFGSARHIDDVVDDRVGQRVSPTLAPLICAPPGEDLLVAVAVEQLPPHHESGGYRTVSRDHLIRDLIGFYGLRADLLGEIETKL